MIFKYSLLLMLLTFVSISSEADGPGNAVDYGASDDSNSSVVESFGNFPNRDISIIVTKEGYYPKKIAVFKGEKIRFFVTSTMGIPGCFMMPKMDLFLAANRGRITEKDVKFDSVGEFNFHCPTGNMRGKVTVLERPDKVRVARRIASEAADEEAKPSHWMPREQ